MGRQNAHQMIETVYVALHKAIIDRQLRPGQKLREQALGEYFGVSRTTIRAALQHLASDGLVTTEPNKGASVALPSVSEVAELFQVRLVVETGIAAELCARSEPALIERLRAHIRDEQKAMAAGDYKQAISLLGEFHVLLAEAASTRLLSDFFKGIVSRTSLVVSVFDDTEHAGCRSDEHVTLVDCIEAKDVAGAIGCVQGHLRELEAAVTAKAKQAEAGYHPMQHVFGAGLAE